MRRQVEDLLRRAGSDVHGRFAWLPRLANRDVRLLERALGEHLPAAAPHVYVCSSIKEEFGISVLEAMEAGLLVVAPRRGGAGSYVRNGVTGFLTDNSTPADLAADLSLVLGGGHLPAWLASIAAEGQRSVRAEYGITTAARRFAGHYLRVGGAR
jgi:glycosyltransferase involved in cell wall biosynthesis